jgi:hypothetical protein
MFLSLSARLAIALRLCEAYCERRGLAHPEIAAYLEYLWRFLGLPESSQAFNEWETDEPVLVSVGLGDSFPPEFEEFLTQHAVSHREFRKVLSWTTEVLYGSMYAKANWLGSYCYVRRLIKLVARLGVPLPDICVYSASRWVHCQGWGARLSPEELAGWRSPNRQ